MKKKCKVEIVETPTMTLCSQLSKMQRTVWGISALDVIPPWKLFVTPRVGGYIIVAWDGDYPVAHALFTHAVEKGTSTPYLYLDMIGVLAEYQGQELGERIIRKSQELAHINGYESIQWTYDPLEGANANLYIRKVGAVAIKYYPDYYGKLSGKRQRGSETDRFLAHLSLDAKPYKHTKTERTVHISEYGDSQNKISTMPKNIAIEVPADFRELIKANRKQAHDIRLSTRRIFQDLLSRNYLISGFHREDGKNYYIANQGPRA